VLKIEFEAPEHGWLPVRIAYKDIEEIFHASDVPIDPISQLENVLASALTGWGGEVWWHLEPGGYYLNLHAEKDKYKLKLEYSVNSKMVSRELVFEYLGCFEETVLPIWRSLRKLQSRNWNSFRVSDEVMISTTNSIKSRNKD